MTKGDGETKSFIDGENYYLIVEINKEPLTLDQYGYQIDGLAESQISKIENKFNSVSSIPFTLFTNYQSMELPLDSITQEFNNTDLNNAFDFGLITGGVQKPSTGNYSVNTSEYYKFTLGDKANTDHFIKVSLRDQDKWLNAGIDESLYTESDESWLPVLFLVDDANNIINNQKISSFNNGSYSLDGLEPGTYNLVVNAPGYLSSDGDFWPWGYERRGIFYNLEFNAPEKKSNNQVDEDIFSPVDLGLVDSSSSRTDLSIQNGEDQDVFQFRFDQSQSIDSIKISFQHLISDIDVELLNRNSNIPILKGQSLTDDEIINISTLPSGDYDLKIYSHNKSSGNYSINFEDLSSPNTPDSYESSITKYTEFSFDEEGNLLNHNVKTVSGNNIVQSSSNLLTITGTHEFENLTLNDNNDVDFYYFTLDGDSKPSDEIQIRFDHSRGDIDVELHNAIGNLNQSNSTLALSGLIESSTSGTDNEKISLKGLNKDDYILKIFNPNNLENFNNSYSIKFDTVSENKPKPDEYETLVGTESIINWRLSEFDKTWSKQTIHNSDDVDSYSFTIESAPSDGDRLEIVYLDDGTDLLLEIYD